MDTFIRDILDLSESQEIPTGILHGDSFHGDNLLKDPSLHANLAFYDAWKSVTGAYPSRLAYWDFSSRSSTQPLTECFLKFLPSVRVVAIHQTLLQGAPEIFQRAQKTYGASYIECKRALLLKMLDRHCLRTVETHAHIVDSSLLTLPLADAVCKIYLGDGPCFAPHALGVFEAWCRKKCDTEVSTPPTTLSDYTARMAYVNSKLSMDIIDQLTDTIVAEESRPVALSCIEAMRHGVCLNGYMWRKDTGGSVFVSNHETTHPALMRLLDRIPIRHTCMPWRIFISSCPPKIYQRIFILADNEGELDEIVRTAMSIMDVSPPNVTVVPFLTSPRKEGSTTTPPYLHIEALDMSILSTEAAKRSIEHRFFFPVVEEAACQVPCVVSDTLEAMQIALLVEFATIPFEDARHALHDFVVRYAHARDLLQLRPPPVGRSRQVDRSSIDNYSQNKIGDVVVIDSRPNIWSVLSALVTMDNLDPKRWGLVVFCGNANSRFMERHLQPIFVADALIIEELPELCDGIKPNFDIEDFNTLLKSGSFWGRLGGPHALLVQDDGMIVRPGMEDGPFLSFDFVGAPWIDVEANAELKRQVPSLVGNGGLSLRHVAKMFAISEREGLNSSRLFNHNLQPVPEDVFFSSNAHSLGGVRVCPAEVAEAFSIEQRKPVEGAAPALGFHKPWPYIPREAVREFFDQAVACAFTRK